MLYSCPMSAPTAPRRIAAIVTAVVAAGAFAACSTPASGDGTLDAGRERVSALVRDTATALPATTHPSPVATGTAPCRRKFLGYSIGSTGRHVVEAPVLVNLDSGTDARALLDAVEARWRSHGFTVDSSGRSDARYPKITARTPDGYRITATAILYGGPPRLDLYAVSQCLAGT